MVTTIQLNENVKRELDKLKKDKKTYEEVILELINLAEQHRREQVELLEEGYREMAEESLNICNEFKYSDSELDQKLRV